ncbi:MAG: hypothetical protein ACSHW0_06555 [Thalassotalea sp.]
MSDEGYPTSAASTHSGCVEIWNNLMDSSMNIISYPGATAVTEWSALRFGPACVYINHSGSVFSSTSTPFFSYFPATGTGAGFNID